MGATAALLAQAGHAVKFVSVTNGDAGHHKFKGPELAARRYAETQEVARRLGVQYDVLDHHDGQLMATLEIRHEIIRLIREWRADLVLGPRPNDYHPDHRYTGLLIQDAAFLVTVPAIVPEAPALRKNPVFLYFEDGFQRPNPFRPDIAVIVDDAIDRRIAALDAHVSQFYEWLPWLEGTEAEMPADPRCVDSSGSNGLAPGPSRRNTGRLWSAGMGRSGLPPRGTVRPSKSANTGRIPTRSGSGSSFRCCRKETEVSVGLIRSSTDSFLHAVTDRNKCDPYFDCGRP